MKASVVMIVMKGPRASGYFGIGEVASREDISADPFPQLRFRAAADCAQPLQFQGVCTDGGGVAGDVREWCDVLLEILSRQVVVAKLPNKGHEGAARERLRGVRRIEVGGRTLHGRRERCRCICGSARPRFDDTSEL